MPTILLLLSALLLLAIDQVTKARVMSLLGEGEVRRAGPVRLRRLINRRRAGRLDSTAAMVALLAFEIVALSLMVTVAPLAEPTFAAVALGAALGGAIGNTLDRLRRDGVVDFIDVGFWPVFNIADVAISLGTVAALVAILA